MNSLLVVLCLVLYSSATQVKQCSDVEKEIENIEQKVKIGSCNKPPCRLRKGSTINTEYRFTPDHDVKRLENTVYADILGIPFPFVGVNGQDACKDIYKADGRTKVEGCNLKAGEEYVYKYFIEVLDIYPKIKTVVRWALTDPNTKKDVICFTVPARITS